VMEERVWERMSDEAMIAMKECVCVRPIEPIEPRKSVKELVSVLIWATILVGRKLLRSDEMEIWIGK
jgi:hypothetical protein